MNYAKTTKAKIAEDHKRLQAENKELRAKIGKKKIDNNPQIIANLKADNKNLEEALKKAQELNKDVAAHNSTAAEEFALQAKTTIQELEAELEQRNKDVDKIKQQADANQREANRLKHKLDIVLVEKNGVQRRINELYLVKEEAVRFHVYLIEAVRSARIARIGSFLSAVCIILAAGLLLLGAGYWGIPLGLAVGTCIYLARERHETHAEAIDQEPVGYNQKDRNKIKLAKNI